MIDPTLLRLQMDPNGPDWQEKRLMEELRQMALDDPFAHTILRGLETWENATHKRLLLLDAVIKLIKVKQAQTAQLLDVWQQQPIILHTPNHREGSQKDPK